MLDAEEEIAPEFNKNKRNPAPRSIAETHELTCNTLVTHFNLYVPVDACHEFETACGR